MILTPELEQEYTAAKGRKRKSKHDADVKMEEESQKKDEAAAEELLNEI